MKVMILLAQCTGQYLKDSVAIIKKVLKELDVEIEIIELSRVPYFNGEKTKEMNEIVKGISLSKGIIAMTNVPMLSMHGAMQTFFDSLTVYDAKEFNKPMLAITYSEWLGEAEAAEKMLKMWNVLGGVEGNRLCLNKGMNFEEVIERLERMSEDFYRIMKQDRNPIVSTERQLYDYFKQGKTLSAIANEPSGENRKPEIKNLADILKNQRQNSQEEVIKNEMSFNSSPKEQTIKEITSLLKEKVNKDEHEFVAMNSGVYKKPTFHSAIPAMGKYLQQIPHYFIAQYDKEVDVVIKYNITDSEECGYIIIKDGDCRYEEISDQTVVVDLSLTEATLLDILKKRITYQKAFMLGKLKVKGNFSILPKVDQLFGPM